MHHAGDVSRARLLVADDLDAAASRFIEEIDQEDCTWTRQAAARVTWLAPAPDPRLHRGQ